MSDTDSGSGSDARKGGYDEWLDAVAAGEGHYLACPEGHGWLPPRRICPTCGARDLREEPLPETGEIETASVVHVATPRFEAEAPYATAIAAFGPVRLTGVVRGVDPDGANAAVGATVEADVDETEGTGDRLLVLRPR